MFRLSLPAFFMTALLVQPAQAADPLEIVITLKNHVFEPQEPKVPANQPLLITVVNDDDTPEEFESTPLKIEKIVAPKSSIKLRVKGLAPARYEFFGEYNETAKGALIVE
ncbi:cupredoxin domain-containing protein [Methyloferula stellata]|uniref:cupredoxin domain-containing protein n=1 Tax=Methyloferula stellata TaxID=876270 RepID=UPI00036F1B50|nr:cupredoxin domain-containing protein [Methyloferula stellata]